MVKYLLFNIRVDFVYLVLIIVGVTLLLFYKPLDIRNFLATMSTVRKYILGVLSLKEIAEDKQGSSVVFVVKDGEVKELR